MSTPEPPPSTAKVLLRRTGMALGLLLILLIPAVIMSVLVAVITGHSEPAASWAAMPAIAGLAALMGGGVDLGIICAIVLALLAPLSIVAGITPITGAALMALMCLTVGRLSRFGLNRATMLVPIFVAWTIINPPFWGVHETVDRTDTTYLSWMAAIFFVGAIFPVIVLPIIMRSRKRPRPQPQLHSRREAIPYTAFITILASVGTYYFLAHPHQFGGAFLIATILVLAPIGDNVSLAPTIKRIVGTIIGSVFVIAIVTQVHSLGLIYGLGLIFGVAAVVSKFSSRDVVYYILMVPTAACLNAYTIPEVGQLGEQRVVDNIVGGLLVLLAVIATLGFSRLGSHHEPAVAA